MIEMKFDIALHLNQKSSSITFTAGLAVKWFASMKTNPLQRQSSSSSPLRVKRYRSEPLRVDPHSQLSFAPWFPLLRSFRGFRQRRLPVSARRDAKLRYRKGRRESRWLTNLNNNLFASTWRLSDACTGCKLLSKELCGFLEIDTCFDDAKGGGVSLQFDDDKTGQC